MYNKVKRNIKSIIFDLDNVLYDEKKYVLFAYKQLSHYLAKEFGVDDNEVYLRLVSDLKKKTSAYPKLFDDIISSYISRTDRLILDNVLTIYSSIKPDIRLYKEVKEILTKLRKKYKLVLLTNGRIETQKNKVEILMLINFFDLIVYARQFGSIREKPSIIPYKYILNKTRISAKNTVAVEDNPYTDFKGAKDIGILTIRVMRGEFKSVPSQKKYFPDFTISNLKELQPLLEGIKEREILS